MNAPIPPRNSSPASGPLVQLVLARAREFYRQPEAVFWVYFFPLLMVIALGIAFRSRPVETAQVDVATGPWNETLAALLEKDAQIVFEIHTAEECRRRLRTGRSSLWIQPRAKLIDGFDYYLDPTRPGSLLARDRVDRHLQTQLGRRDAVKTATREVSEPGGRYIDFLIPGLIGMGLMGGGLWGVGFAIVDMRIRKLLKRFLATPMRRTHFLIGIMVSRMLFMIPEMVILVVFSRVVFGVLIYGKLLDVAVLIFIGAIQFSGVGLLIAARAKTLESVSGLMNLAMLPMWTLSGIFFAYDRFPAAIHPAIKLLPLTPLIDALRSVMMEGETLANQGPELAVIAVWSVASFALALKIFRWHD